LNNFIISIDGPAGSGKQKIAKYIAKKYRLYHLDSGILYRRLAFLIIKNKIDYSDLGCLSDFIKSIENISDRSYIKLRSENISKTSSKIATIPKVRIFINMHQKKIVSKKLLTYRGCVIDGRDIGAKVFKDARIKLFINVNSEIRAKRRHKQLIEQGEKSIYSAILKEINLRDYTDKNRLESPMIVPKGSVIIDNSYKFSETTNLINRALIEIK
jgi:cytidylate kinase